MLRYTNLASGVTPTSVVRLDACDENTHEMKPEADKRSWRTQCVKSSNTTSATMAFTTALQLDRTTFSVYGPRTATP